MVGAVCQKMQLCNVSARRIIKNRGCVMGIFEIIRSVPWEPHVGDPTLFGWLTVAAYLLAAVACAVCAWRASQIFGEEHIWQHRLLWGGLALAMLFLGLNKQLDLQSWFTAVIKAIAWEKGLYDLGRQAQAYFIAGLALISLLVFGGIAWTFRHMWRHTWLLLLGLVFIARFVVVRAAGFYGVPLPRLSALTGGIQITWMLEILGALVIALAAILNIRRGQAGGAGNG